VSVLAAFWLALSFALGLATFVVLLLRRPLRAVLVEVCGTETRANFWTAYSTIAVVLATFLGMLASFPLSEGSDWADHPWLPSALSSFRLSILFLLFALGGLGFVLLLGIDGYERSRRLELSRPPPVAAARGTTPLPT
jgi:hypothetical protein